MKFLTPALLGICAMWSACALAQPATAAQRAGVPSDPSYATLHLKTNIGSFKMVSGQGRVEVSFTGSLLISQLKDGSAVVAGNVRREYEGHGRELWFGTGKAVITGSWRAIQWFGRNMNAVWFGRGAIRLAGEFDKNLNTGEYWFDDPKTRNPWMTAGLATVTLPPIGDTSSVKPSIKDTTPKAKP